ncbi:MULTISPECIES: hypothetical protein [unclassified Aliiroseovarius]|nr:MULTISPECIES: hypothetical protein [unclassified Aliiroseovarius]
MTQEINAIQNPNTSPESNFATDNELVSSARNITGEKIAKGHFHKHDNWISDEEMGNDLDVVVRGGSRQYVNGEHRPNDIIMIEGIEVEYETAVSLGLVTNLEGQRVTPQEVFEAAAENAERPSDAPLEGTDLLAAQIDMATDGNAENVLNTFASDIVENGEIGEAGLDYAARHLGMNEQVVHEQYEAMREVGGDNILEALEVGDGLGHDRVDFLVDRFENGNPAEQKLVRQMWTAAALGKMDASELQQHFDQLYSPYA